MRGTVCAPHSGRAGFSLRGTSSKSVMESGSWKKKKKEAAAQLIRSVDKAEEQQRLTWRFGEVKRAEGCGDGSGRTRENRWRD